MGICSPCPPDASLGRCSEHVPPGGGPRRRPWGRPTTPQRNYVSQLAWEIPWVSWKKWPVRNKSHIIKNIKFLAKLSINELWLQHFGLAYWRRGQSDEKSKLSQLCLPLRVQRLGYNLCCKWMLFLNTHEFHTDLLPEPAVRSVAHVAPQSLLTDSRQCLCWSPKPLIDDNGRAAGAAKLKMKDLLI